MGPIPLFRCRDLEVSLRFYTQTLDFELLGRWPEAGNPGFAVLVRGGGEFHLSSHSGDGVFGAKAYCVVPDAQALFAAFCARGFTPPHRPESPIHQGPTHQTWGAIEFCAEDPDGNTLCFGQRLNQ